MTVTLAGNPAELYTFNYGTLTWNYTSADHDIIYESVVYTAISIQRNNAEQTQDISKSPLTVTMPATTPFALQYVASPPVATITLIVRQIDENMITPSAQVIWSGRVANVKFNREITAEIRGESIFTSIRRPALRRMYQRNCPYVLYEAGCRKPRADLAVATTVTVPNAVSVSALVFAAQPNGWYNGGYIEWSEGGAVRRRYIISHVGQTLTVSLPIDNLTANSTTITVYPGCDHTLQTCINKFNNVLNFGGEPWIPTKNPMGATSVF